MSEQTVNPVSPYGQLGIIVIVGVDGEAVGKGRETRRRFPVCTDYCARTFAATEALDMPTCDPEAFGHCSGNGETQPVEDRFFS